MTWPEFTNLRKDPFGAHRFSLASLRGDIFGGLTTAVISLPLALAFGIASGAGAQAGLVGAVMVGLFAALFGGARTVISEPTGPMTVIMTAVITQMMAQDPEHGMALALGVVLIAGLTQIFFGLLKLGHYITLMPYSVISGFMSGIGILLILMQLFPMSGLQNPGGGSIGILLALPQLFSEAMGTELLLAGITLVVLFVMPVKWRKLIPPHLLALVVVTLLSIALFSSEGVRRIGEVPVGLPEFNLPHFELSLLGAVLLDGILLGILGCIDTLLTSMISDSLTREQHDSNRELIGQGIGNTLSSLFGGLPGAGATMGTVVNIQVGGQTPLAGIFRALILLTAVLLFAPVLEVIPMAVLAAIALKVGVDILDWSFIKRAHMVSKTATIIMYGVLLLTVFVDLLVAVAVGVFIANILTIEKLTRIQADAVRAVQDPDDDEPVMSLEERDRFALAKGKLMLFQLTGPMIFGVARAISNKQEALRNTSALILDLSAVPLLSTTVGLALENFAREAGQRHVPVWVCCGTPEAEDRLRKICATSNTEIHFSPTRLEAIEMSLVYLRLAKPTPTS